MTAILSSTAALFLTQFETDDSTLPAASQAGLTLEPVAYHSPNQRYLYIDPPLPGHSLQVGQYASIKVYSATPSYIPVKALSFMVRLHDTDTSLYLDIEAKHLAIDLILLVTAQSWLP